LEASNFLNQVSDLAALNTEKPNRDGLYEIRYDCFDQAAITTVIRAPLFLRRRKQVLDGAPYLPVTV
jgi:hypothetical protein